MLGMLLAHRLAQQGQRVTLFEAAKQLGGLASAWQLGEVVWDRHYHVMAYSDTCVRALLAELGLDQELQWVETRTGFYTHGGLYSLSNTLEFLRFPPLGWLDKLRLGATIVYASRVKNWQKLERISVTDWLQRWSGRRTFEQLWLPLLRAKLGDSYTQTSAAFIWTTIARMYAARRSGMKREMFGYVPGGYARIVDAFAALLRADKVCIQVRQSVQQVRPTGQGRLTLHCADGQQETYDQVVLTLPAPLAAQVCPGLSAEETRRLQGIRYQGILCASVLLQQPFAPFYVTNITDSWVPFTAVINMSALVGQAYFGGKTLLYLPKYVTLDDPAWGLSDRDIEAQFLAALARMYPHFRPEHVVSFRLSRVRYVFAIPTLHYSTHLPPVTTSIPGLHIVNSAHILNGTLNVNETLQLAERTATRLLRHGPGGVGRVS